MLWIFFIFSNARNTLKVIVFDSSKLVRDLLEIVGMNNFFISTFNSTQSKLAQVLVWAEISLEPNSPELDSFAVLLARPTFMRYRSREG
jgi:hypothetical protein